MLRTSPALAQPRKLDQADRFVRYVLVPAVFVIGVYGLVRYVATGTGATSGAFPLLEQQALSTR